MAEVGPLVGVHHDIFPAFLVVVFNADGLADVFLCDAQFFFHAEFNGKSVGVPSRFTLYLEPFHCLESTEGVLEASCQNVVNAWMSVGRWGAFEENKRGTSFSLGYALVKHVFCIPLLEHFFVHVAQVELIALCEFLAHIVCVVYILVWGAKVQ